jgi:hypothetical protein
MGFLLHAPEELQRLLQPKLPASDALPTKPDPMPMRPHPEVVLLALVTLNCRLTLVIFTLYGQSIALGSTEERLHVISQLVKGGRLNTSIPKGSTYGTWCQSISEQATQRRQLANECTQPMEKT